MIATPCTSHDKRGNLLHEGEFVEVSQKSRAGGIPYRITRTNDGAVLASCFTKSKWAGIKEYLKPRPTGVFSATPWRKGKGK